MGTSSSLFNAALTTVNGVNATGLFSTALQNAIAEILTAVGESNNDISVYKPNPFWQYNHNTGRYADAKALTLVDGGEDGQNIPLHPLIQPNRHVDVVFAVDSSADSNASFPVNNTAPGWPGGVSLIATYERSQSFISNGTGG
jgi:lysophospholipase